VDARFPARWQKFLAGPVRRRLARYAAFVPKIAALETSYQTLDDYSLRKESLSLRYRAKSGEPLEHLLPEAFALVREAGRRALDMRHYDVQLVGGVAMHQRSIAEMQTGEGKTLTATLPLYLNALRGKGAHLATANDYLAKRDAEWMMPLYAALGMTVGIVQAQQPPPMRRAAYACDITYGTAKEFGFDFLRDRLLQRAGGGSGDLFGAMLGVSATSGEQPVQRGLHFMLADEADSILIDEARTPLVISALPTEDERLATDAYRWAAGISGQFNEREHFEYEAERREVTLLPAGRRLVRQLEKPAAMQALGMFAIYEYAERAIKVSREMIRDRQFVVRDGEVVIVDEFTGRLAEGRKWRSGIHQAVEAKEGLEITFETGQAARITVQDFFLRYERVGGMTGTAATSAREMLNIYNLRVLPIPTNRPPIRKRLADRVFGTSENKWKAIVAETLEMHAAGRPVLIGTRSIDKSELVSSLLQAQGLQHDVLNANRLNREADIVRQAGERGRITVSTNMAGRGTDIKLGPEVEAIGGLHVICSEMHESARIDRQLIGRCGRQGDPGTFRQYLALDDDLLKEGLGPRTAERFAAQGEKQPGSCDSYRRLFAKAQRRIERKHFRDRKVLLYHERERKKLQLQMGQDPYLDSPD
jgi:preprotein translocase subunit SecA